MSSINRAKLKALRVDIDDALKVVGEKHNVQLRCGNVRYNDTHASFKLEIASVNTDGEVMTKERTAFIRNAALYGLDPDMLDKEFNNGGERYKLVGLNVRSYKYPVLARKLSTGQTFKFSVNMIEFILSEQEEIVTGRLKTKKRR